MIRHSPPGLAAPEQADAVHLEALLSDWFGRNVVLLSSGRVGLQLLLAARGLGRYRDLMRVPPYLSRCVINAVTHHAMPVLEGGASATLLYHQYGFEQRAVPPEGFVVEDIAHAFFATPDTGERRWRSDAAIFTLPKFFGSAGLAGGVIVEDEALAEEVRGRAAAAAEPDDGVRAWMRSVVAGVRDDPAGPEARWLEAVYELLYVFPLVDPADLAGVPDTARAIAAVGAARAERVAALRAGLPRAGWEAMGEPPVPYALPYFDERGRLERMDEALAAAGIHAGIYHVDVRRDMFAPDYRPCILLPCHQGMTSDDVSRVVSAAA